MDLDSVEFIMEVEQAFGIKIPDGDAESLRSIDQTADYLLHHGVMMTRAEVVDTLRRIAARTVGLPLHEVREKSRFVEDLGFD